MGAGEWRGARRPRARPSPFLPPLLYAPKIVRLARVGRRPHPHVRQQLLVQDVARKGNPLGARGARRARALADVVERRLLGLHRERFLDRRAQGVEHLGVGGVVHDVFNDVAVRRQPQRAERDDDRHIRFRVGQRHAQRLPAARPRARELAHRDGGLGLDRALGRRPALGRPGVFGGGLFEDVAMVVGHALLCDEHLKEGRQEGGGVGVGVRVGVGARAGVGSTPNPSPYLLRPVDDKVAALVERAFPQLGEFRVAARVGECAVGGAEHDRHLPDEDFGVLLDLVIIAGGDGGGGGSGGGSGATLATLPPVPFFRREVARPLRDVHVERCRVRETPQARVLGEQDGGLAVGFRHRRLGEIDLAKPDGDLPLGRRVDAGQVLGVGAHRELAELVHDLLWGGREGGRRGGRVSASAAPPTSPPPPPPPPPSSPLLLPACWS